MTIKLARRTLTRFALAWTVGLALTAVGCKKKSSSDDDDDDDDDNDDEPRSEKTKKAASDDLASEAATEGNSFTGTWQTAWGKVTLVQAGTKVSGAYTGEFTGTLDGVVSGNEATLTWSQTNGEGGKAKYRLAADGQSFTGTWGSRASSTNGGAWNGKRIP